MTDRQETTLNLSRAQQWVLHHVLLDRLELEANAPAATDPPSPAVYRAFDKLDHGCVRFTRRERHRLCEAVRQYADAAETPERDRPIAERVLAELRDSLAVPTTAASADRMRATEAN
ncbi:DUF7853 family protein [Natronococcus occultus]|uniref:Uncharacterized protein n=1 Tax=Natronococcus occultus SP4 TaxID=694430 RepID=L0K2Z4_9EURY|nr:hypothetical protein [Natronococcus occultus]AGB38915.1 hypothetical protein Natoc_3176 [Natronococcus occultus SP4]